MSSRLLIHQVLKSERGPIWTLREPNGSMATRVTNNARTLSLLTKKEGARVYAAKQDELFEIGDWGVR